MGRGGKFLDHRNLIIELSAPEGSDYKDFKVNRWGWGRNLILYEGQEDKRGNKSVFLYVKVIGLRDIKAQIRNWGLFSRKLKKEGANHKHAQIFDKTKEFEKCLEKEREGAEI